MQREEWNCNPGAGKASVSPPELGTLGGPLQLLHTEARGPAWEGREGSRCLKNIMAGEIKLMSLNLMPNP